MVDVYLPIEDRQILALSIPFVDIERLSLRPVKWIRFLIFSICGVRGDLATTPNGPPVEYDNSTLDNMDETYYFVPEGNVHIGWPSLTFLFTPLQGDYHLIDFRAINDQATSSARTRRSANFRSDIIERDG